MLFGPHLVKAETLSCDRNGIARFRTTTQNGQAAQTGWYKIVCSINISQVHIRGVMVNEVLTAREFVTSMDQRGFMYTTVF